MSLNELDNNTFVQTLLCSLQVRLKSGPTEEQPPVGVAAPHCILAPHHVRERSSITSSGFPKFWTPHPLHHRDHRRSGPPTPLNWWCNTWMSVIGKNVQFCKESTIQFAGWPDESAKNTTIYSPFRTWSELSNNRFYKFQFVLMYNLTFIRNIIRSG